MLSMKRSGFTMIEFIFLIIIGTILFISFFGEVKDNEDISVKTVKTAIANAKDSFGANDKIVKQSKVIVKQSSEIAENAKKILEDNLELQSKILQLEIDNESLESQLKDCRSNSDFAGTGY